MSKQTSLFKFGFTKEIRKRANFLGFTRKVKHRGELIECSGEKFVAKTRGNCKCQGDKYFQSKQGFASHVMWTHAIVISDNMKSQAALKVAQMKIEEVRNTLDCVLATVVCRDESNTSATQTDLTKLVAPVETTKVAEVPKKRKRYDFVFKMKVIEEVDAGIIFILSDVAFHNHIDKSLVSRWVQNRKEIIDGVANKHRRLLKKNSKSHKHESVLK